MYIAPKFKKKVLGFTAIELMVTIAIMAVLMALALPSFRDIIERWRVTQYIGEFESTIYKARSEGIKRGGNVFIQKRPNNTSTPCNRATATQDWGCGWFIYYSPTGTSPYNGTDELLQEFPEAKSTDMTLLANGSGADVLKVDRWGTIGSINSLSMLAGPVVGSASARNQSKLCLSTGGRIFIQKNDSICPGA